MDNPALEHTTMYAVMTEGDWSEGRTTKVLGYATGQESDIEELYDSKKAYRIWLKEIQVYHVTPESSGRVKRVKGEISTLEKQLAELRKQLPGV